MQQQLSTSCYECPLGALCCWVFLYLTDLGIRGGVGRGEVLAALDISASKYSREVIDPFP